MLHTCTSSRGEPAERESGDKARLIAELGIDREGRVPGPELPSNLAASLDFPAQCTYVEEELRTRGCDRRRLHRRDRHAPAGHV